MLSPYNVKIKVYCANDTEAQKVQQAVSSVSSDVNLIGAELLTFTAFFYKNEEIIKPLIVGVFNSFKKGIASGVAYVIGNIRTLFKVKI